MPVRPKEVLLGRYKGSPDTLEGITFVITGVLASMSRDEVRRGRKIYTGARDYSMHSLVQSLTTQFVLPPPPQAEAYVIMHGRRVTIDVSGKVRIGEKLSSILFLIQLFTDALLSPLIIDKLLAHGEETVEHGRSPRNKQQQIQEGEHTVREANGAGERKRNVRACEIVASGSAWRDTVLRFCLPSLLFPSFRTSTCLHLCPLQHLHPKYQTFMRRNEVYSRIHGCRQDQRGFRLGGGYFDGGSYGRY